jgi:uncharacterized membrane protein YphA (DoxX/SURF4 family)
VIHRFALARADESRTDESILMNVLTRIFLVLLRLAIGWHFLFEGLDKLDSYFRGTAEGKSVWSSEAYLRESTGPLAPLFREQLGDPNQAALDRLTLPLAQPGLRQQLPPALVKDWQDNFNRFVAFYHVGDESWTPPRAEGKKGKWIPPDQLRVLGVAPAGGLPAAVPWPALMVSQPQERPDKLQLVLARVRLEHAEEAALDWLIKGKREVEVTFSKVTERVVRTTPQRIETYKNKLRELRDIEAHGLMAFGKDVWKRKLGALKDEIITLRTELLADLNRPTEEALEFTYKNLTPAQRELGPLPPREEGRTRLWWINQITMWGITAVGTCLIVGLFTRTACLGGAAFLLMVYLAMPALPWLPINPRAEGHYFFVNKNIIEMLALLTLATTHSGRWAGLDGLLYFFGPWRLRKGPRPVTKSVWGAAPGSASPSAHATSPTTVKEPSHGP